MSESAAVDPDGNVMSIMLSDDFTSDLLLDEEKEAELKEGEDVADVIPLDGVLTVGAEKVGDTVNEPVITPGALEPETVPAKDEEKDKPLPLWILIVIIVGITLGVGVVCIYAAEMAKKIKERDAERKKAEEKERKKEG